MSRAQETIVIQAPVARVFQVIRDYERYPEFLPEMQSVHVLSRHDNVVVARFELELMMRFSYTLRLQEDAPNRVSWSLEEARTLVANDGAWELEAEGPNTTRAVYSL